VKLLKFYTSIFLLKYYCQVALFRIKRQLLYQRRRYDNIYVIGLLITDYNENKILHIAHYIGCHHHTNNVQCVRVLYKQYINTV